MLLPVMVEDRRSKFSSPGLREIGAMWGKKRVL
jgi:hypothetical protein